MGREVLPYLLLRTALQHFGQVPSELAPEQHRSAEQLALRELALHLKVLATPEAGAVVISPDALENALRIVSARYEEPTAFSEDLARNDLELETLREALRQELVVEAVVERVLKGVAPVSDLEAEIYYLEHREKFHLPESRSARHLLITINPDFPENTPAAARRRLEEAAEQIKQGSLGFAEAAQRYSECPSALQEGRMGRVTRGKLYPELEKVLFGMAVGEMTITESPLGCHLLWCEQIHPAGEVPFQEVKEKIRERLEERRRKGRLKEWLKGERTVVSSEKGMTGD